MSTQTPVKVLFRAERAAPHEVTAVFPELPGTNNPHTFTVYAHLGQHGSGAFGWYVKTRAAKPSEYRDLARELRRIGYKLTIGKRFTRHDDKKRANELTLSRLRAELATKRRELKEATECLSSVDLEPGDIEQAQGEIDRLEREIANLTK